MVTQVSPACFFDRLEIGENKGNLPSYFHQALRGQFRYRSAKRPAKNTDQRIDSKALIDSSPLTMHAQASRP